MKQYGEKCLIVNGGPGPAPGHHGTVRDTYTHGHHASVLRSHTWRTAENSAAHLLAHLAPGQRLLDVGCGPGTITLDLAERVAPGPVVGFDASPEVLAGAAGRAPRTGGSRAAFCAGDAYALPFGDAAFDVVHAHQVLQHLGRPVEALVEMGRVLRPGGVLAVRDSDYAAFAWAPADPWLDRWLDLYHRVTAANGGEADAGRHLLAWVRAAGFAHPVATSSTWTFADPAEPGVVGRAVGRAGAPLGLRRPGPRRRPRRRGRARGDRRGLPPLGGRRRRLLRRAPRRGHRHRVAPAGWGRRPPVCDAAA